MKWRPYFLVETDVVTSCQLTDMLGQVIWSGSAKGHGRQRGGFFLNLKTGGHVWEVTSKRSMDQAVGNALRSLLLQLTSSAEVHGFAKELREKAAFLGWASSGLEPALPGMLTNVVVTALKDKRWHLVSEDRLAQVFSKLNANVGHLLRDELALGRASALLGAGTLIAGEITQIGSTVRLRVVRFDGDTGVIVTEASREASSDDLSGLVEAVRAVLDKL